MGQKKLHNVLSLRKQEEEVFYNVLSQTKYVIEIERPTSLEELTDMFISAEELNNLSGRNTCKPVINDGSPQYVVQGLRVDPGERRRIEFTDVIKAEISRLGKKLDESGKKTIPIEDEELLDILKKKPLYHYDTTGKYGRRGNRLCYAERQRRKKKKPTKGDVRDMWDVFSYAFKDKFDCYPPHAPVYMRTVPLFKAYQKIIGWRLFATFLSSNPEDRKWYRMIWDKPEEYV